MKSILSRLAVTTFSLACRSAAAAAAISTSFRIAPPWMLPIGFASLGSIWTAMIVLEALTGFEGLSFRVLVLAFIRPRIVSFDMDKCVGLGLSCLWDRTQVR